MQLCTMRVPQTEIILSKDGIVLNRLIVTPGEYVVGRGQSADVVLDEELVSERHAQLTVNYYDIFIEDLGSSNGTFAAGRKIDGYTRLWPSQKVQIGRVVLEVRRIKAASDSGDSIAPQSAVVRRALPEEFLRERKYEIGSVIAEGGMGAILDAYEATTHRHVAMKVMLGDLSETGLLRFIWEAQITSQLEHPNIVPVHELSVDEHEQVFYTMKYAKGITLKEILEGIAAGDPETIACFPLSRLLRIFQNVCNAIAFAHSKKVIHRDLKPENVMVGEYGEVLVMDWGLAKVLGESESTEPHPRPAVGGRVDNGAGAAVSSNPGMVTMEGSVLGTPLYMSPEQANAEIDRLDTRTDIYSLGAILYQILTLHPPAGGGTVEEILNTVRSGRIEPILAWERPVARTAMFDSMGNGRAKLHLPHLPGGRIPESLAPVAMKALAFDPDDRYATVTQLQVDITAYQGGFATHAEDAGLFKQIALLIGRHKLPAAILVVSIAVLLCIGSVAFVRITDERNIARNEKIRAEAALGELKESDRQVQESDRQVQEESRKVVEERNLEQKARTQAEMERQQAETERQQAKAARLRAEAALADLKNHGAAFQGQERALADEQKFDDALEKIVSAIAADPNRIDDDLARANTLESTQHLAEAADGYRRVLALPSQDAAARAAAKTNLDLCERLLKESQGNPLGREQQTQLLHAIVAQKRASDSVLLAKAINREADARRAGILLRLSGIVKQDAWSDSRLRKRADGNFALDLSGFAVRDLSFLHDLPISSLHANGCGITNLTPLAGLPLTELELARNPVTDLAPLAHLPLTHLSVPDTRITSLLPLAKVPLEYLDISHTDVTSLDPLLGKKLSRFMAGKTKINDLSALHGMPLETLTLGAVRAKDLSVIAGMPLKELILGSPSVHNLQPLRGMPLRNLDLADCKNLTDCSVLATCTELEAVTLPPQFNNIALLHALPALKLIGTAAVRTYDYDFQQIPTAETYFASHTKQPVAGR